MLLIQFCHYGQKWMFHQLWLSRITRLCVPLYTRCWLRCTILLFADRDRTQTRSCSCFPDASQMKIFMKMTEKKMQVIIKYFLAQYGAYSVREWGRYEIESWIVAWRKMRRSEANEGRHTAAHTVSSICLQILPQGGGELMCVHWQAFDWCPRGSVGSVQIAV